MNRKIMALIVSALSTSLITVSAFAFNLNTGDVFWLYCEADCSDLSPEFAGGVARAEGMRTGDMIVITNEPKRRITTWTVDTRKRYDVNENPQRSNNVSSYQLHINKQHSRDFNGLIMSSVLANSGGSGGGSGGSGGGSGGSGGGSGGGSLGGGGSGGSGSGAWVPGVGSYCLFTSTLYLNGQAVDSVSVPGECPD